MSTVEDVQAGTGQAGEPREAVCHSGAGVADLEKRPVPPSLRRKSWVDMGTADLSKDRYLDQGVHDLEVEKMWTKVWQMACRADDIPEVGDTFVYQVAHLSIIVTRVTKDEIKGLHQRLPAPRHPAAHGRVRQRAGVPLPVTTDVLEPRRGFESAPCEWT